MNNPLTDIMSPKTRKVFYAILFVGGIALAAWQASNGDWVVFGSTLVAMFGFGTAASNITKTDDAENNQ